MPIPQLSSKLKYQKTWKIKKISDDIPRKKRRGWLKKLAPYFIILILLFLLFGFGVFAWFSKDLPDPDKILERSVAVSTQIYDRTGQNLLYDIHGEEKRTIINLEEIPESLKWATIAIEDKDFYKHKGFSLWAIFRTAVTNILRGHKAGASTLTQQFVKNAILTSEKTYTRKIKEVVLAYQIETKFSKDQILKLYFNEIPYGSVAYGVESASQTYFGKSARDLTLDESALLAALPQAPTYYSPYGSHQEELIGRQQYILDLMAKQGYITEEEAEQTKGVDVLSKIVPRRENIVAPHFVFYVKEKLTEKYGEKMVEQGGLKVYTTLDMTKQKAAEETIARGMSKIERYGGTNAALVALDTKTGQILTMVGSHDYFDIEHDGNVNVAIRDRQPGSSFKPVVYATAFKMGYTPETMLFDLETDFATGGARPYHPHNYDLTAHGPVTMRQALAGSLNIPAVKTLYLTGISNVLDTAHKLGYTTLNEPERYGLSLVLGGGEVKLLDHTAAFATLAREGVRHPITAIVRIEDKNGKIIEEFKEEEGERVFDQQAIQQVNSILSDNQSRAFVFGSQNYLTLPDRPVATKTGTTDDFRDAWTLGYTPSMATGVWVGNNDNSSMKAGAAGAVIAAPIWQDFMKKILTGTPVESFHSPQPEEVEKPVLKGQIDNFVKKKIDKVTQKLIPLDCLSNFPSEFIEEKEFKETHTILHFVDKNNPRGLAPDHPENDPQYNNWEAAVQKWALAHGYYSDEISYEECDLRLDSNKPTLNFISPKNNATISSNYLKINLEASSPSPRWIKRIQFYLGEEKIETLIEAPYTFTYSLNNLSNGFYTLRAEAEDDVGNVSKTSINFNLLKKNSASTAYFIQPNKNTTLDSSDFPYLIRAWAFDPKGIQKVDLYYFDSQQSEPEQLLIDSKKNPQASEIEFNWKDAPESGNYRIYLSVSNSNKQTFQSDNLLITIE